MDATTERLIEYTRGFDLDQTSDHARAAALLHTVDAVACAVAGAGTDAARAAVAVARTISSDRPATVFGAGAMSAPAYAAMANTVMVRTLDWNDGMLAQGGGHPSDMIPGLIAIGETCGATGEELLEGVMLAYELLGGIGKVAPANQRGWDQGLFMAPATALAAGRMAGLSDAQLANAVSISIVPSVPMLVTRRGELSMWKGAATSVAIANAINAVALAQAGMTGPSEPFQGTMGVFDLLTGPFEVALPANADGRWVIEISHMKMFPAESHAQVLLAMVPEILAFADVDEIESISVDTYFVMYNAIGRDPSIYDPRNRETADHSLPYLLAVALTDGDITPESFAADRIADPALRPIMQKVTVREDEQLTAEYRPVGRGLLACPRLRVVIRRTDGAELEREVTYPKGHAANPMERDDVDAKLDRACRGRLTDERRDRIRETWWNMRSAQSVSALTRCLQAF